MTVIYRHTPEESSEGDEGEERNRYSGGKSSHRAEGEVEGEEEDKHQDEQKDTREEESADELSKQAIP